MTTPTTQTFAMIHPLKKKKLTIINHQSNIEHWTTFTTINHHKQASTQLFIKSTHLPNLPIIFLQASKGSSPVSLGSMSFSKTVPSRREADQVPLISLASKDHQKPPVLHSYRHSWLGVDGWYWDWWFVHKLRLIHIHWHIFISISIQ